MERPSQVVITKSSKGFTLIIMSEGRTVERKEGLTAIIILNELDHLIHWNEWQEVPSL